VSARRVFGAVAVAAIAAGSLFWLVSRPPSAPEPPALAPAALFAAEFVDERGARQPLGRFQGRILVINFWATWCGPCREEMPAFSRLQARWSGRNVQFVGLSAEEPEPVARFGRSLGINYPLWTGGDAVSELSRRLGNRLGVLPFTVIVDVDGRVLEARVGAYSEAELDQRLTSISAKTPQSSAIPRQQA
jgi:thiol-disulfide isomerase/thioredoxin